MTQLGFLAYHTSPWEKWRHQSQNDCSEQCSPGPTGGTGWGILRNGIIWILDIDGYWILESAWWSYYPKKNMHTHTPKKKNTPSASRTHKFVVFVPKTQFFLQLWKKCFSQKICVVFLLGKKPTFSHTWCHDISWFVPLDDSNPFIDTSLGSIPLSTLHVDYTSTPLALAGSSHKKGPNALGTCPTTLSVITVNLESLDDFVPRKNPRNINWNMAVFFSIGNKWFWIAKVQQTVEQKYRKKYKIMKNQSKCSVFNFNHFGWQCQNPYLSRTKPY